MIDLARLDRDGREQFRQLRTPAGKKGSGYVRYAAAMYFNRQGLISDEILEMYRRCCKLDNEDPLQVALHDGVLSKSEYESFIQLA